MERDHDEVYRGIKVRQCSEYHFQFWQGKRCLLNVWPSQRRYQLAEADGPSVVGEPREVANAMVQASRGNRKRGSRSIDNYVVRAIGSLSQFLITRDERLLGNAIDLLEFTGSELLAKRSPYLPEEEPAQEEEDHSGEIFGR
jgi:hypothetical protein